jgi:hypothetical protein
MRATLAVAVLVCAGSSAWADDYPNAIIDRPLTLSPSMYQPEAAFMLLHDSAPMGTDVDFLQFGLDIGVARHLQIGAFTNIETSPQSQLFSAMGSLQYQLLEFAAVRIDAGTERVGSDLYLAVGLGVPVKLKLTPVVAFISGRPYAYGAEDDIFQARIGSNNVSEFNLPAGLLFQLGPHFSVAARSGYRKVSSAGFVPVGGDIVISYGPLDLGGTVDVAGQISPSGAGYTDQILVRGFAQLRL